MISPPSAGDGAAVQPPVMRSHTTTVIAAGEPASGEPFHTQPGVPGKDPA